MIADFHFLRPWWLLAVLAAGLLVWLMRRQSDMRSRWKHLDRPQSARSPPRRPGQARHVPAHLSGGRPDCPLGPCRGGSDMGTRASAASSKTRAARRSRSTWAERWNATDIIATRLERAKLKVRDIMARRKGARTAIVRLCRLGHMVLPLTEDASLIATYLAALSPALMPVEGKTPPWPSKPPRRPWRRAGAGHDPVSDRWRRAGRICRILAI